MKGIQLFRGILLTGIFALTLLSCSDEKIKGEFTSEELEWLVYEQGDSIQFVCLDGQEHLLIADSRTEMEQLRDYYPIEAELSLSHIALGEDFKIFLLKDEREFKKYLKIGEVYRSLDLITPESVVIEGQQMDEVYVISEDTTESRVDIWQVYFSKQHGIVKYVTRDNREFVTIDVSPGFSVNYDQ